MMNFGQVSAPPVYTGQLVEYQSEERHEGHINHQSRSNSNYLAKSLGLADIGMALARAPASSLR